MAPLSGHLSGFWINNLDPNEMRNAVGDAGVKGGNHTTPVEWKPYCNYYDAENMKLATDVCSVENKSFVCEREVQ